MKRIVIAGGGIAGSALAIRLARAGLAVTLLERETFPRDKLCGEMLSPEAERDLAELGVLDRVLAAKPARIGRFRFTAPSGAILDDALPKNAIGISRWTLDPILFDAARSAGSIAREGAEVIAIDPHERRFKVRVAPDEELDAELVACAHGKRAKLDKSLGRPFIEKKSAFVAMKRHFRAPSSLLGGYVEIHAFEGGYCGLCEVEDGLINACALVDRSLVEGGDAWDALARAMAARNFLLARRLEALEPADDRVLAIAQIPFDAKDRATKSGILFLGDAAGVIAPFAGDGQAIALASARLVANLILDAPDAGPELLAERWNRAFGIHFSPRMNVAIAIQKLLLGARAASATIHLVRMIPGLAPLLVRLTRGA